MKLISFGPVRLSFPVIFRAAPFGDGSEPDYSANFLIGPADVGRELVPDGSGKKVRVDLPEGGLVVRIQEAMLAACEEKWPGKGAQMYAQLEATDKLCLHNGNLKDWDGYADNWYLSTRSPISAKPRIVDRNNELVDPNSGRVYGGCYVLLTCEIFAQDNQFGKRVNAQLQGVQFHHDGDSFGGARPAQQDDFETLPEEENPELAGLI